MDRLFNLIRSDTIFMCMFMNVVGAAMLLALYYVADQGAGIPKWAEMLIEVAGGGFIIGGWFIVFAFPFVQFFSRNKHKNQIGQPQDNDERPE